MNTATFVKTAGPLLLRRDLAPDDRRTLESAYRAGLLTRVLPGTYVPRAGAHDIAMRASALHAWDPDAVIVGRAAANLTFWPTLAVGAIDVARLGVIPRSEGYLFHRRRVDPDHIIELDGVRIASPALTAMDLVPELGGDVIDTCLRSRRARLEDLWTAFSAHRGRPGNTERRRMLIDSRDAPWSEAERLAHRLLRAHGIKGWRTNLDVIVRGALYWIDIAFPSIRLAIEIDGRLHETDPRIFQNDRFRQNALVGEGWTVLRFTYEMLVTDPAYVIREIVAAVRRGGGVVR